MKRGDRVRLTKHVPYRAQPGDVGTVLYLDDDLITVALDAYPVRQPLPFYADEIELIGVLSAPHTPKDQKDQP